MKLPDAESAEVSERKLTRYLLDLGHPVGGSAFQTMNIINELDPVALTCDLPEQGLKRGDVGTAVLVHGDHEAFEVEFVGYDGHTIAIVTVEKEQVRRLHSGDMPHTREQVAA